LLVYTHTLTFLLNMKKSRKHKRMPKQSEKGW
jgi:hypothetical protein